MRWQHPGAFQESSRLQVFNRQQMNKHQQTSTNIIKTGCVAFDFLYLSFPASQKLVP